MRLAEWQARWICRFVGATAAPELADSADNVRLLDDFGDIWLPPAQDGAQTRTEPEAVRIGGGPVSQPEPAQPRVVSTPQDRSYPAEPKAAQPPAPPRPGGPLEDPVAYTLGAGTGVVTDPEEIARIEATMKVGKTEDLVRMFPGMVLGPMGPVPGDAVLVSHPPEDDDPRMQGETG